MHSETPDGADKSHTKLSNTVTVSGLKNTIRFYLRRRLNPFGVIVLESLWCYFLFLNPFGVIVLAKLPGYQYFTKQNKQEGLNMMQPFSTRFAVDSNYVMKIDDVFPTSESTRL